MVRQGLIWATLIGILAWSAAQQSAPLDFFAESGACEIDYDKDGREDFSSDYVEGGVEWAHIARSLDTQFKYGGTASQRVQLQRSSGGAGRYVLFESVNFNAHLTPAVGEPLLVRIAVRAQGFVNATYQVHVTTGSRRVVLLPCSNADIPDWRVFTAVVPVERDSSGQPNFSLNLEIAVGEGAAQGAIWIDEIQALSTRTVMRNGTLPCGIQVAVVNTQHDPYRDMDLPVGITIGSRRHSAILSKHYPNTVSAPYVYFSGTIVESNARYNRDLYDYSDLNQNHPDWFLRDSNNQRMTIDNGSTFYVDVGRPEVRERAWQSLRDFMYRSGRHPYVFFDDVDMRIGANSPAYNDINAWAQAVVGALNYIGSRLQSEFGATIIPNVAWSPAFWLRGMNGGADAPGVATLPYLGGFLIEHAFTHARVSQNRITILNYGTASTLNNWQQWTLRDQIRLATEYPDKIVVLLPTYMLGLPDTQQKLRFAIAGCLMVQHANTYVKIEPRGGNIQYPNGFYPPELFVPLGRWTENFRILSGDIITGGLFVRNYENGIVVWNPCNDRDFTFTVPRDLYDWDRNLIRAGTVVSIPRQTGHVFYSAPEITVELSPQNAEVLPGQTVQFTVTYRNRGTAPGTNVRIAVPLPQGMTLVGSNPQARLENGQVVWIVPSIAVGGQGTLQFTVRVE